MTKTNNSYNLLVNGIVFFLLYGLLGFARDYFFVQINNILYMKYFKVITSMPIGKVMAPFNNLSYETLYYCKYPFTLVWTIFYFFANLQFLSVFAFKKFTFRFFSSIYILLVLLAAFSFLYGFFVHNTWDKDEYTLSRWLMGIAQSPLPALLLFASSKLLNHKSNEQTSA